MVLIIRDKMHSLPYVRCVGIGTDIYQNEFKKAYDSRMICVLDGAGTVEVDAKKYSVKSGDVFIITPGTKYRVRSKQKQKTAYRCTCKRIPLCY